MRLMELLIVAALAATGPVVAAVLWLRGEMNGRIDQLARDVNDRVPAGVIVLIAAPECPAGWLQAGRLKLGAADVGGRSSGGFEDANVGVLTACRVAPRGAK